jgi:hypothetical protein
MLEIAKDVMAVAILKVVMTKNVELMRLIRA